MIISMDTGKTFKDAKNPLLKKSHEETRNRRDIPQYMKDDKIRVAFFFKVKAETGILTVYSLCSG